MVKAIFYCLGVWEVPAWNTASMAELYNYRQIAQSIFPVHGIDKSVLEALLGSSKSKPKGMMLLEGLRIVIT